MYSSKNFTSFTAFSVTVGNIVWELHQSLCMALAMENSILVIIQLLKCLAALIQNTPYHRLKTGLITQLVENVRPYLRHKGNFTVFMKLYKWQNCDTMWSFRSVVPELF